MKKKICLLYGGKSGEHEVSQRSAASLIRNLDPAVYDLTAIGITHEGLWYLQEEPRIVTRPAFGEVLAIRASGPPLSVVPGRGLYSGSRRLETDCVFPLLHGSYGEDGTVQGLLELAELCYVGAGVLASALAMDKEKSKQVWRQAGLPVLDWLTVYDASEATLNSILSALSLPLFDTPAGGGSSVGISKVAAAAALRPALEEALRFDVKVLVEPALNAREIECSVLGNRSPLACVPGEIVPSHEFYDYAAKYVDPDGARLVIPAQLPEKLREGIRETALEAYRQVECAGMARVDFLLEADAPRFYISEINTIPGFTDISMYPKLCEASGISYAELLERLFDLAAESHRERQGLRTLYDPGA
jgi:D-alanine-D-alanine ligase